MKHAATPAQLCATGDGIEYFFVGDGGVQPGPRLDSISSLIAKYPASLPVVELYGGVNPLTKKPIWIGFIPSEKLILVSTYYEDTPYSIDKPYVFTIDENHQVVWKAW